MARFIHTKIASIFPSYFTGLDKMPGSILRAYMMHRRVLTSSNQSIYFLERRISFFYDLDI